ncbi:hypothetical protein K2173_016420 [Erythroxylum novogranatense]|uniref:Zinc finger CCCH domain-containing protein 55-like n=1 Tax=Erythroxylum novogranatense TaxID=1862640 RepID=A0AAV8SGH8_9ROSI|nr:hypothetical protein K2173_016420 [Erythroxylum novogranatense]
MDLSEATNLLLSKIKTLDPENASKIMGWILIQGLSDADLVRLAFGPDTLLQDVVMKAKTQVGFLANTFSSSCSTPISPLNPISRPNNSSNPFSLSSPRLTGSGSGSSSFVDFGKNHSLHSRTLPGILSDYSSNNPVSTKSSPFLSYDNIRSGSVLVPPFSKNVGNNIGGCGNLNGDMLDECHFGDYLSFLDESSSRNEEFVDQRGQLGTYSLGNGDAHLHRRRFSESDAFLGVEDESFGNGYRPCMYFAKGYCKNGDNCKFIHGGIGDNVEVNGGSVIIGSPREMDRLYLHQHEEMLRVKAAQHQRRLAYNKYLNFLLQQQSDTQRLGTAAEAIMGDEFHKVGRFHHERNDLLAMGMIEKATSASRQIYLTFPADSTFKDEDVSNYFSTFGPVQDVRIPYQQKRMFGFVTFVHPETVKIILARGNPHFICDSRVLVKPYKEKGTGRIPNDRRQQHVQQQLLERTNFPLCSSPSGLDSRELYDLHLGTRMLYNNQEMILRKKLEEQAELQQAIELQGRRLINLELPEVRGDYINRHQRSLSVGTPVSLPTNNAINQDTGVKSDVTYQEALGENVGSVAAAAVSSTFAADEQILEQDVNATCFEKNSVLTIKDEDISSDGCDVRKCHKENVDQALPDSLFASPSKLSKNQQPALLPDLAEIKEAPKVSVASSSMDPVTSISKGTSQ